MVIDHIGIVVRRMEEAVQQWEALLGYRRASNIILNTRQKVRVVFMTKKDSLTVKLIEPSEADSPISLFAQKGGGLHHLCFRCSDLAAEISGLVEKGAVLVVPPEPGEAFNNHEISFLRVRNNLNIELIDTSEKQLAPAGKRMQDQGSDPANAAKDFAGPGSRHARPT